MKFKRIFLVVLDSLGVGEARDAGLYHDEGCNTLGHIKDNSHLFIPNLKKLGFLNTLYMDNNEEVDAYYTVARPTNIGKDSLSAHYELVGIKNSVPFKNFSETGFPREMIEAIEAVTGRRVIGNKYVDDPQTILQELGEREMQYGSIILYTSTDANIQIAAHEDTIPLVKLYQYSEKIRKITMREEWRVGRIIARPFTGKSGKFKFTNERKDYAVKPPKKTVLDFLKDHSYSVIGIGKISDIFDGEGITKTMKATTNIDVINKLTDVMEKNFTGLCMANLQDFDSIYAHKKDIEGYANAIEELDVEIPLILNKLNTDDLLIITADHGNDPTFQGNNHTRENVPVLLFSRDFKDPHRLDIRESMADIAATIAENFEVETPEIGTSFLEQLK